MWAILWVHPALSNTGSFCSTMIRFSEANFYEPLDVQPENTSTSTTILFPVDFQLLPRMQSQVQCSLLVFCWPGSKVPPGEAINFGSQRTILQRSVISLSEKRFCFSPKPRRISSNDGCCWKLTTRAYQERKTQPRAPFWVGLCKPRETQTLPTSARTPH